MSEFISIFTFILELQLLFVPMLVQAFYTVQSGCFLACVCFILFFVFTIYASMQGHNK